MTLRFCGIALVPSCCVAPRYAASCEFCPHTGEFGTKLRAAAESGGILNPRAFLFAAAVIRAGNDVSVSLRSVRSRSEGMAPSLETTFVNHIELGRTGLCSDGL
jgi:hypothetical protein